MRPEVFHSTVEIDVTCVAASDRLERIKTNPSGLISGVGFSGILAESENIDSVLRRNFDASQLIDHNYRDQRTCSRDLVISAQMHPARGLARQSPLRMALKFSPFLIEGSAGGSFLRATTSEELELRQNLSIRQTSRPYASDDDHMPESPICCCTKLCSRPSFARGDFQGNTLAPNEAGDIAHLCDNYLWHMHMFTLLFPSRLTFLWLEAIRFSDFLAICVDQLTEKKRMFCS
jgi:hypothetical protein